MATFPKDQFDEFPDELLRVGAHRGPRKKGRGWLYLLYCLLATAILVVGGLFLLSRIDANVNFDFPGFGTVESATPTPTPTVIPTAEPVLDPAAIDPARGITITVLNGTETAGLQGTASEALAALGWTIGSQAPASEQTIEQTFVYYSDPANEDVARGLAIALGVGEIRLSDAFQGASVTIVLGADYPPQ